MKKSGINLHMEQKRALAMMLFFALAFSLISIFSEVSVRTDLADLNSLLKSDYDYSVFTSEPVFQDDYYQFDAGINFMVSAEAKKSINAEILMQSEGSDYTNSIDWNTGKLESSCVAVSEGLARSLGLRIGDVIYSKHIVDGLTHEYTVQEILHERTNARESKQLSYHDGIIIMGYDGKYANGISSRVMVFTKETVQQIDSKVSGTPEDIIYRSDEIAAVVKNMVPYILVFVFLAVLFAVGLVFSITKAIKYNFKRLSMLGFEKKAIDQSYRHLVYKVGFTSILIAFLVSMAASQLFVFCVADAVFLISIMLAEVIGMMVSEHSLKSRLWR